jgi:cell division protease FtsH
LGNPKNLAFWAILILLLVTLFSVFQDGATTSAGKPMPFSDFLDSVDRKEVTETPISSMTCVRRASRSSSSRRSVAGCCPPSGSGCRCW